MSNPQTKYTIELLQAADETRLPFPLLKRHLERLGEKGVCDSQLTVLHRKGFDADLYEATAAGTLERVDRTALRSVLGLSPNTSKETDGVANYNPKTGIYTFEVDYDQSLAEKTAESERDPRTLAWVTDYATDEKFPDDRTGRIVRTGRIMHFDKRMGQDEIDRWAERNGRVLARPKELVDFSKSFPHPALDGCMPLVATGQFWTERGTDRDGSRFYLCLSRSSGNARNLSDIWMTLNGQHHNHWGFLVLDK